MWATGTIIQKYSTQVASSVTSTEKNVGTIGHQQSRAQSRTMVALETNNHEHRAERWYHWKPTSIQGKNYCLLELIDIRTYPNKQCTRDCNPPLFKTNKQKKKKKVQRASFWVGRCWGSYFQNDLYSVYWNVQHNTKWLFGQLPFAKGPDKSTTQRI